MLAHLHRNGPRVAWIRRETGRIEDVFDISLAAGRQQWREQEVQDPELPRVIQNTAQAREQLRHGWVAGQNLQAEIQATQQRSVLTDDGIT